MRDGHESGYWPPMDAGDFGQVTAIMIRRGDLPLAEWRSLSVALGASLLETGASVRVVGPKPPEALPVLERGSQPEVLAEQHFTLFADLVEAKTGRRQRQGWASKIWKCLVEEFSAEHSGHNDDKDRSVLFSVRFRKHPANYCGRVSEYDQLELDSLREWIESIDKLLAQTRNKNERSEIYATELPDSLYEISLDFCRELVAFLYDQPVE